MRKTTTNRTRTHKSVSSNHAHRNASRTNQSIRSNHTHNHKTATSASHRSPSAKKNRRLTGLVRRTMMVLICFILFGAAFHIANHKSNDVSVVHAEEHLSDIQYKVVQIECGDTLWGIAKEYMSPAYKDINEYIDEIKECNQLSGNDITSGNYLMIPYYEVISADTVTASKN